MKTSKNLCLLAGRLIISASFVVSLTGMFTGFDLTVEFARSNGMTMATEFWVVAAIILVLAGVILLISGFRTRIGAVCLLVFLIPVVIIFHHFWTYNGADRMTQMGYFFSDTGLIGGLLMILASGAGRYSIDFLLIRKK